MDIENLINLQELKELASQYGPIERRSYSLEKDTAHLGGGPLFLVFPEPEDLKASLSQNLRELPHRISVLFLLQVRKLLQRYKSRILFFAKSLVGV